MEWYEYPEDPIRSDFRNFLYLVWAHLGLPQPTTGQYEFAYFLQHGYPGFYQLANGTYAKRYDAEWDELTEEAKEAAQQLSPPKETGRSDIIEGFRGVGKSFITAAFALWCLLRDPVNEKILVVSATSVKAREFVAQVKGILMTMELLAHLRPGTDQRDQVDRFDVKGASISQSPSLKAAGITGQVTGSRATRIIADDIEIVENSRTEDGRKNLLRQVSEFDAILVPGSNAQITFLGTPQTEESIYNALIKERGYLCFCFPARYPKVEKRTSYYLQSHDGLKVDILAPSLRVIDQHPELAWKPTDPTRFGEVELVAREGKGRSFFMLQFMLDTSLSDAERYPLKQFDLIVMHCNRDKAPTVIQWGKDTDRGNVLQIPNVGFSGDYFLGPLFVDPEWREYEQSLLYVDPSGRGKDETAWAVVKVLHGIYYLLKVGGIASDTATSMEMIARDAKHYNVSEIKVEPNYGGEVWIRAFAPILARVWPGSKGAYTTRDGRVVEIATGGGCAVSEGEWSKGMKEARIIDTLEPVMNQHRLVADVAVAEDQVLMYQLTHLAKERNCLSHDDRIESVAGAVSHLSAALMQDMHLAAQERYDEELGEELEDFIETCLMGGTRTGRAKRRNGERHRNEVYSWGSGRA